MSTGGDEGYGSQRGQAERLFLPAWSLHSGLGHWCFASPCQGCWRKMPQIVPLEVPTCVKRGSFTHNNEVLNSPTGQCFCCVISHDNSPYATDGPMDDIF